uniref:Putative secreted protein n=1 Tax=Ixodes ricinus TaxID=34613 RepID=A0A6B0U3Z2_IXORI
MKPSLPPNLVKLANVWIVLAIRVRLRAALSSGYSGVRPNRLGERMAGHRKRRKMDPLMRLSHSSSSRCPPDSRCR